MTCRRRPSCAFSWCPLASDDSIATSGAASTATASGPAEDAAGNEPIEILGDSAYGTGEALDALHTRRPHAGDRAVAAATSSATPQNASAFRSRRRPRIAARQRLDPERPRTALTSTVTCPRDLSAVTATQEGTGSAASTCAFPGSRRDLFVAYPWEAGVLKGRNGAFRGSFRTPPVGVTGQLTCCSTLERVTGIEPAWPAWKAWDSKRHRAWSVAKSGGCRAFRVPQRRRGGRRSGAAPRCCSARCQSSAAVRRCNCGHAGAGGRRAEPQAARCAATSLADEPAPGGSSTETASVPRSRPRRRGLRRSAACARRPTVRAARRGPR